jgi:coenzyme Q-binding protein COQ10
MPKRYIAKTLPYTQKQLYDLVADIESYPTFLPWCEGARINSRKGNKLFADLLIGFDAINGKYTSHVTLDPENFTISVELVEGPFHHLTQKWEFTYESDEETNVCFDIDFKLRVSFLEGIVDSMFEKAFDKMMHAFEKRAHELFQS